MSPAGYFEPGRALVVDVRLLRTFAAASSFGRMRSGYLTGASPGAAVGTISGLMTTRSGGFSQASRSRFRSAAASAMALVAISPPNISPRF